MTIRPPLEYTVLELFDNFHRNIRATPLNLGGVTGSGGGTGGPPGGFVGQLPQRRVAYDTTEAATLYTPPSGMSLVDNLNHIRYHIGALYSGAALIVEDFDGSPSVSRVNRIVFSGATITNQGYGRVLVAFSGGVGGGGSPITVMEADGSPSVSNTDLILFSGLSVADQGSGDALVYVEPQRQGVATRDVFYPVLEGLFLDSGASYYGLYHEPYASTTDVSSGALTATSEFASSITPLGIPGVSSIGEGVYVFRIRARRLSGTKNVKIKARVYKRTSGGSETQLVESNETPNLTGSFASYVVVARGGPFMVSPSDRLVVKYAATPYDSGTNPTAEIRFNDSSDYSTVEFPSAIHPVSKIFYTGGWTAVSDTWSRTANHIFAMTGDRTSIYRKGTRIKYKDSGGSFEYGVVYSSIFSAGTTSVDLIVNTSYTMAAGSITERYISYDENPEGFPTEFTWNPNGTWTLGNGTLSASFFPSTFGYIDFELLLVAGSTTSMAAGFDLPTDVHVLSLSNTSRMPIGLATFLDAGTASYAGVLLSIPESVAARVGLRALNPATTYTTQTTISTTIPFTWATGDSLSVYGRYQY